MRKRSSIFECIEFSSRTKIRFSNITETQMLELADFLAPLLKVGDSILLYGDIGCGKSVFARGVIHQRFRIEKAAIEDVPSPTFTIVQVYDSISPTITHVDLYRISDESELADLDTLDNLNVTICIIEWPEIMGSLVPSRHISMKVYLNEIDYHSRNIVFDMHGKGWELIFKNFVERLSNSN